MIGRVAGAAYVLTVAVVATVGFTTESTAGILLATVLALPSGFLGLIVFYLSYGLLAQVPGANPDSSSGSMSCSADGECQGSSIGDLAPWFVVATDVVGILALTGAALLNVVVLGRLVRGRRAASDRTRSGA